MKSESVQSANFPWDLKVMVPVSLIRQLCIFFTS